MPIINDPDGLSQGGVTAVSDAVFTGSSGATTTITSAGTNLPAVTAGDFLEVRDHSTAGNNGLYEVTGSPTTGSVDLTKHALTGSVVNPADAGSEAINTLGTDANEKNVHFDTGNLKITFLNGFGSTTVLDDEGVTFQALYSFCKEEWKNDNDLIKFTFPLTAITPEQFEFSAWAPVDEAESSISTTDASNTRQLLRSGGWDELDASGFIENQYFGWVTLGNIDGGDNAYYFFDSESAATDAVFDGPVNESVQSVIGIGNPDTCDFATSSTITRATGSFVTDGFLVDDRVLVQNADTAGNNGSFVITAVAATTLTVSGTPFTTGLDTNALLAVDRRQNVFTCRIRVFGKTYDQSTSTDIGVSQITNQVYRFPLSESTDNVIVDLADSETAGNIATLLANITGGATAPYDDMAVGYFAAAETRSGFNALGGDTPSPGDAQFGVVIEGDAGTVGGGPGSAEQIYAFVQAELQRTTNINDPNGLITGEAGITIVGQLAEPLLALASTGNTMSSLEQVSNPGGAGGNGVVVDNFDSNDTNRVAFVDNDGDTRTFPFVAAGSIQFNSNLSTDALAIYRMFFTNDDTGDDTGRDFGTINAITVEDNTATEIEGGVPQSPGGSSVAFTYDYDGNAQRGSGSEATDAPITIVAIGCDTGQYVLATGTITRATGLTFSLVAALERNFSNP